MAIPDYQTLMLPVVRAGAAGEIAVKDCIDRLAREFKLTDDERAELLPSGKQTIFSNRVQWAKTYLVKAGLLRATKRGHFAATDRGHAVLAQKPERIDSKFLAQFEEFRQFKAASAPSKDDGQPISHTLDMATPEERLEAASLEIDEGLRLELLDRIVNGTPAFFEKLVVDLLLAMNYGAGPEAGRRVGKSGDGGIDGIINEDALGLDTVYIQAKKYGPTNGVGIEKIHEFAGAMAARNATKGVFVTTSYFTAPARATADRLPQRLILIDGEELSRLLLRYGVGVRTVRSVQVKKLDLDYFEDEEA